VNAATPRALHDVRIWRPVDARRMVAIAGRTTEYSFSPVDEYVIGTVTDGPLVVRRHRERHTVLPGESCVWDPEHAHGGCAPDGAWTAELLLVPASELIEALDGRMSATDGRGAVHSPGARALIAELHRCARDRDRLAIDVQLALVAHALFDDGPAHDSTSPYTPIDRGLREAHDLLVDRLVENITLADLSARAGMDRFHFTRRFKAAFGLPPHTYRLHLRLLAAQRRLEHGGAIATVAADLGFYDQSHLHRHFRRRFGISPARYASAFVS
jgi:AraC-like DNA-binding protein